MVGCRSYEDHAQNRGRRYTQCVSPNPPTISNDKGSSVAQAAEICDIMSYIYCLWNCALKLRKVCVRNGIN